jgi:hypothetical protein
MRMDSHEGTASAIFGQLELGTVNLRIELYFNNRGQLLVMFDIIQLTKLRNDIHHNKTR